MIEKICLTFAVFAESDDEHRCSYEMNCLVKYGGEWWNNNKRISGVTATYLIQLSLYQIKTTYSIKEPPNQPSNHNLATLAKEQLSSAIFGSIIANNQID